MEDYKSVFPSLKYNYISSTLSMHEVATIPRNMEAILYRKASCECLCCLSGNYNECVCLEQSQEYPDLIQMVKHRFTLKNDNASEEEEDVIMIWIKMNKLNRMRCLSKQRPQNTSKKGK